MSQCDRVLAVLADGRTHTVPEIHERAGTMRLNSRVAELRNRGHQIECVRLRGRTGADAYAYRLLDGSPPSPAAEDAPAGPPVDRTATPKADPPPQYTQQALPV